MRGNERILKCARSRLGVEWIINQTYHERLEIGSPPLSETVPDFPLVVDTMGCIKLFRFGRRGETLVQSALEAVDVVFAGFEVVAWTARASDRAHGERRGCLQLEKRVRDLEHEDVGVAMVVHDEDALYGATHAKVFIVVLETLQAGRNRGVFFGLGFLGADEG